MYTTIIFDVDGTLIDTNNAILKSLRQAIFESEAKDIPDIELKHVLGMPGKSALKLLDIKNAAKCMAQWDKLYRQYFKTSAGLYADIIYTLYTLKSRGISLGVVTSKDHSELIRDFEALLLPFDLFSFIVYSEMTEKHKPDPAPILYYLDQTKAVPEKCLYVGDTLHDMKCSKGAGLDFALALWGACTTDGINADYFLSKPSDLIKLAAF